MDYFPLMFVVVVNKYISWLVQIHTRSDCIHLTKAHWSPTTPAPDARLHPHDREAISRLHLLIGRVHCLLLLLAWYLLASIRWANPQLLVNWHSLFLCFVCSSRRTFHHVELFCSDWIISTAARRLIYNSTGEVRHGELRLHLVVSKAIVPCWLLLRWGFDSSDDRAHTVLTVDAHASVCGGGVLPDGGSAVSWVRLLASVKRNGLPQRFASHPLHSHTHWLRLLVCIPMLKLLRLWLHHQVKTTPITSASTYALRTLSFHHGCRASFTSLFFLTEVLNRGGVLLASLGGKDGAGHGYRVGILFVINLRWLWVIRQHPSFINRCLASSGSWRGHIGASRWSIY